MTEGRSPAAAGLADAMPVEVAWEGTGGDGVRQWLETALGWQPVDAATAAVVPPVCGLGDVEGVGAVARPSVLLLRPDDDPLVAARVAVAARPAAVVRWPEDRDRLAEVVAGVLAAGPSRGERAAELSIGGAAGGVGTTTVALALGGLAAWAGSRALVVSHGVVPAPAGRVLAADDLAGVGTWRIATPVPGVDGLRVVRAASPVGSGAVPAGEAQVVVRDAGRDRDADVLVVRRDRAGMEALQHTTAGIGVVVDVGAAPQRVLVEAAGGRSLVVVGWSQRVARAALAGRVPASLPGTWLRALKPVLVRPR